MSARAVATGGPAAGDGGLDAALTAALVALEVGGRGAVVGRALGKPARRGAAVEKFLLVRPRAQGEGRRRAREAVALTAPPRARARRRRELRGRRREAAEAPVERGLHRGEAGWQGAGQGGFVSLAWEGERLHSLETVTRLTSAVAQSTMGATFQVKSFEVALKVTAWIMIMTAAAQTLDKVNAPLSPSTSARRTAYKIPKRNISVTPAFCILGRCSRMMLTTGVSNS